MSKAGGVLITGSSTGIGEACALKLHELGYEVFAGVRQAEDGQSLRQKTSERLHPVMVDITNAEQVKAAAETVRQGLGDRPLAGLINNAGISVGGPLEFVPIDRFRNQLEVNLIGHISVYQSFIPLLRQSQGRIINVGSIAGFFASPILGPYSASKYAMEAVADVMRRELKPWNIKVILLEPGVIATKIWEKARTHTATAIKEAPAEVMQLYGALIERVTKLAADNEKIAQSPEVVANAVVRALTANRPKTRYRIGPKARLQKVLSWLPDKIQDRLVATYLNWGI